MFTTSVHEVTGINRNIVECKYKEIITEFITLGELIETLWNVNTNKEMRQGINTRINRNILECRLLS